MDRMDECAGKFRRTADHGFFHCLPKLKHHNRIPTVHFVFCWILSHHHELLQEPQGNHRHPFPATNRGARRVPTADTAPTPNSFTVAESLQLEDPRTTSLWAKQGTCPTQKHRRGHARQGRLYASTDPSSDNLVAHGLPNRPRNPHG